MTEKSDMLCVLSEGAVSELGSFVEALQISHHEARTLFFILNVGRGEANNSI